MTLTDPYRTARHNAIVLFGAQAVVGAGQPIVLSMGGLAGAYLLGADKSLATAPITAFTLGTAFSAIPAAMLMRRVGRRNGFIAGAGVTALGGLIAALALFQNQFWLFALGLMIIGGGSAFLQQYRFAAADGAPSDFKPKAISWVMMGGILAAVIGPQLVIHTRDLFEPVMFAGSFASIIGLALVGGTILAFLRPTELKSGSTGEVKQPARPLIQIIKQQRFITAIVCGISSFALMNFVMVGAPLAMIGCGFTPNEAALGISWHMVAMYGPSFFTGHLIARFGKDRMVAFGMLLIMGAAAVALSGIELWQFWLSLVLLGLGWNFSFISATAMVSECYRPSEKNKVEGLHDFLLFTIVAIGSLMSGRVYNAFGWEMVNWVVFPVAGVSLALLALNAVRATAARSEV